MAIPPASPGDGIPFSARLVAVADTLDAMTSARPYRPAYSYRHAAAELLSQSGRQFDPVLIDMFKAHRQEFAALVEKTLRRRRPFAGPLSRGEAIAHEQVRLEVVS